MAFVRKLETQYGKIGNLWLMDRGVPTEETLREMRVGGYKYLVGAPRSPLGILGDQLERAVWEEVQPGIRVKVACTMDESGKEGDTYLAPERRPFPQGSVHAREETPRSHENPPRPRRPHRPHEVAPSPAAEAYPLPRRTHLPPRRRPVLPAGDPAGHLPRPRPGLTPRQISDKFKSIKMVDVILPTTDNRTVIPPATSIRAPAPPSSSPNSA